MVSAISSRLEVPLAPGDDWIRTWLALAEGQQQGKGVPKPAGFRGTATAAKASGFVAPCTLPAGACCAIGAIANAMGASQQQQWVLQLMAAFPDSRHPISTHFVIKGAPLPFQVKKFKLAQDTPTAALKLRCLVAMVSAAAGAGQDLRLIVAVEYRPTAM
jgi:hypothetical protein